MRSIEKLQGIGEQLDLLASIGVSDYKFVVVAVGLAPNLILQSGLLAFEEPDHAAGYIGHTRPAL